MSFFKNKSQVRLDLLKTSFQYQAKQFFENSTLHGARYLTEKGHHFCEKFLWLICLSVGTTVTMIIIVTLWEKFQTNPTITGLDTDFHNWDVEFPGIALCQRNPQKSYEQINDLIKNDPELRLIEPRDKLIEYLSLLAQLSYETISNISKYKDYTEFPQNDLKTYAHKVIAPCEEKFTNCTWEVDPINCCEAFLPIFSEVGFCYGFNFKQYEPKDPWTKKEYKPFKQRYIYETDTKWEVNFMATDVMSNPYELFILMSIDQPGVDFTPQHKWDGRIYRVLMSAKTTYTTADAQQLSMQQRRCVFPEEIPLYTDNVYTYGACMRECRMKFSLEMCKCVPFFYKQVSKFPYCDVRGLSCVADIYGQINRRDLCSCQLGCENTNYDVEKLLEATKGKEPIPNGKMELAFVSWPIYRYKREVLFGWVDLLVSFGGIAGLFLGFSLLSGVEIIYYFTLRTCCMFRRDKDVLEEVKTQYESEEKPPLDLSLKPAMR